LAVGNQFHSQFGEGLHLAADGGEGWGNDARVAGGAAQAGELGEDVHSRLSALAAGQRHQC